MIVAKWKDGFEAMYKGVDPQAVAEEIKSIGDQATAQQIVDKARNADAELHKCFEWDDTVAAENWRLKQARDVVHFLVIREQEVPKDRPEIRFFYKPDGGSGYKQTTLIVRKEDEYQSLLRQAYSELRAFKAKYGCLAELADIMALID